jgi:hypothetical protein
MLKDKTFRRIVPKSAKTRKYMHSRFSGEVSGAEFPVVVFACEIRCSTLLAFTHSQSP